MQPDLPAAKARRIHQDVRGWGNNRLWAVQQSEGLAEARSGLPITRAGIDGRRGSCRACNERSAVGTRRQG
jgi:hypothetical protein